MTIYLTILNDRHIDPQYYPFDSMVGAVGCANALLNKYSHDGCEIVEETVEGFVWLRRFCVEGDYVGIVARELNPTTIDSED